MPKTIVWPGSGITHVALFRVLHMSALVDDERKAQIYIRAGYVQVNEETITNIHEKIPVNTEFSLTIRFKSGVRTTDQFMVVPRDRRK